MLTTIQNQGRQNKPRNTTFRHFPSHTHKTKQNKQTQPFDRHGQSHRKTPKNQTKIIEPRREKEREGEGERASTILQNPTNYNQTKPSTGNHNKCICMYVIKS